MLEGIFDGQTEVDLDELHTNLQACIAHDDLELPILPRIMWQLLSLPPNDMDAAKLYDLLQQNQPLATYILHVINSPAYAPHISIRSVHQAIEHIGPEHLGELAFAGMLRSRVFAIPQYEFESHLLWQHAVATAAVAKTINDTFCDNMESAFVSGLLHDIGKPVILRTLHNFKDKLGLNVEASAASGVMEAFHEQVGRIIADDWELPPQINDSIGYHHDYLLAPIAPRAAMLTRLADVLAYHLQSPYVFDRDYLYQHPIRNFLDFTCNDIDLLLAKIEPVKHLIHFMS